MDWFDLWPHSSPRFTVGVNLNLCLSHSVHPELPAATGESPTGPSEPSEPAVYLQLIGPSSLSSIFDPTGFTWWVQNLERRFLVFRLWCGSVTSRGSYKATFPSRTGSCGPVVLPGMTGRVRLNEVHKGSEPTTWSHQNWTLRTWQFSFRSLAVWDILSRTEGTLQTVMI